MNDQYPNGIIPGAWMNVTEPGFENQMQKAKLLAHKFNMAIPGSREQREALKDLLQDEPDGLSVLAPVYFDYGMNTHFGKNVFVNHGCYFMDGARITIGDHVFIGPYCGFYTASHPLTIRERNQGLEKALPITIEDDCWLGANVSILQGVVIKKGCVIAAGSVVTKSFKENSLIAGIPARLVRILDQSEVLLE